MQRLDAMRLCGVTPARFLLPEGGDMTRWSVIACDQFTSRRAYWQQLDRFVGDAPSALRIILPEAYLEDDDADEKIAAVVRTMEEYGKQGVLRQLPLGIVAMERTISSGVRRGAVVAIDLECYAPDGSGAVRPTEETIASRVPPRMRVRRDAALELSHVMLLCDDRENTFFDALFAETKGIAPAYDFDLNMQGGHLRGTCVSDADALCRIDASFAAAQKEAMRRNGEDAPFIVVGDGNHSLAAAKAHWERLKKEGAAPDHPVRFAMAELVNIHDPAVCFAPIHRAVFDCAQADLETQMMHAAMRRGYAAGFCGDPSRAGAGDVCVPCRFGEKERFFVAQNKQDRWAVHIVQELLDDALGTLADARIDYIHGDEELRTLCAEENAVGFFLPATDKNSFFRVIGQNGSLPRKTFSIGEATQKRYYTEARAIRP